MACGSLPSIHSHNVSTLVARVHRSAALEQRRGTHARCRACCAVARASAAPAPPAGARRAAPGAASVQPLLSAWAPPRPYAEPSEKYRSRSDASSESGGSGPRPAASAAASGGGAPGGARARGPHGTPGGGAAVRRGRLGAARAPGLRGPALAQQHVDVPAARGAGGVGARALRGRRRARGGMHRRPGASSCTLQARARRL